MFEDFAAKQVLEYLDKHFNAEITADLNRRNKTIQHHNRIKEMAQGDSKTKEKGENELFQQLIT